MNATSIARPSSNSPGPRPTRGTSRGQESEEMAGAAALLVESEPANSVTSIAGLASSSSDIRCTYRAVVEESHLVAVDTSTEATARVSDHTAPTASKKTATTVRRPELLVITDTSGTRSGLRPKRVPSFDTQRGRADHTTGRRPTTSESDRERSPETILRSRVALRAMGAAEENKDDMVEYFHAPVPTEAMILVESGTAVTGSVYFSSRGQESEEITGAAILRLELRPADSAMNPLGKLVTKRNKKQKVTKTAPIFCHSLPYNSVFVKFDKNRQKLDFVASILSMLTKSDK